MISMGTVHALGDWLIDNGFSTDESLDCYIYRHRDGSDSIRLRGLSYQEDKLLPLPDRIANLSPEEQLLALISTVSLFLVKPPTFTPMD